MSKTEVVSDAKTPEKISICDLMKNNTSQIIKKFESHAPAKFQQFSDLYTSFLHSMDDVYGSCYISEKEFFDKLNIDQRILKSLQEYSNSFTKSYLDQLDQYEKYRQEIIKMQISSLNVFDNFMHTMMDSYAKTLNMINEAKNY